MSLLVTIEGLDGAGKSLLAEKLAIAMQQDPAFYSWVYVTKEPGSIWTGIGPSLRKLVLETPDFEAFERELIFYVDASLHRRMMERQNNAIFVSDRGLWSHLAYLRGCLKTKQMDYDAYELCKKLIKQVCALPDCVVYLKSDLDLMKERLQGKKADIIESNSTEYFQVVDETYQILVTDREWTGEPLLILDARGDLDNNIVKVINYLKEVFDHEQLREGNREICRV